MSCKILLGSRPSASLTKLGIGSEIIPVGSDTTSSTAMQVHPPVPSGVNAPSTEPKSGGIAPVFPGNADHCWTLPLGSMMTLPAATGVFGDQAGLGMEACPILQWHRL